MADAGLSKSSSSSNVEFIAAVILGIMFKLSKKSRTPTGSPSYENLVVEKESLTSLKNIG